MNILFADSVINISLTGTLARIELGTMNATPSSDPTQKDKRNVTMNPSGQLVMPIEGFLKWYGMQEQIIKKLIADGVIKQEPSAAQNTSGEIPGSGLVS